MTPALLAIHLRDYSLVNPYQHLLAEALRAEGVEVVLSEGLGRLPVLGAVRAYGTPDILHLHWPSDLWLGRGRWSAALAGSLLVQVALLRARGVTVAYTAHNLADHERRKPRLEATVNRLLARLADLVFVHAEASRQPVASALDLCGRRRPAVHVVPHPSYVEAYDWGVDRPAARAGIGLRTEQRVVAHVGQLRPYKGALRLMRTFADLPGEELRLLVAGRAADAVHAAELRRVAARDPRVVLRLGTVPAEDLPTLYAAADVVALPYADVLTSGSCMLALSAGRVVVGPATGALPEVLSHQLEFLYRPEEPDGLRRALARALGSDLSAAERRAFVVASALDWTSAGRRTAQAYRATLRASPRGTSVSGRCPDPWSRRRRALIDQLNSKLSEQAACLLLDEDQLALVDHRLRPFPARGGGYTGPPGDDGSSLVRALASERLAGATHLAVAWTASWWLREYPAFRRYLRRYGRRRIRSDAVELWSLG